MSSARDHSELEKQNRSIHQLKRHEEELLGEVEAQKINVSGNTM